MMSMLFANKFKCQKTYHTEVNALGCDKASIALNATVKTRLIHDTRLRAKCNGGSRKNE